MDIVGHCVVAELSGAFQEEEIYGPGIVELMMPNYVHCHDWAYRSVWTPEAFPAEDRRTVELLRAHIVNDWVVHYGTRHTHVKEKCGWAFRRSGFAESLAVEFFEGAAAAGLLEGGAADPRGFDERQLVDFGHTFTEYAGDMLLADEFVTPARLQAIKRGFAQLERESGHHSHGWVLATCDRLGMTTDHPRSFVEDSIRWMAHDAAQAETIVDLPVRTAMRKWRFHDDPRARRYIHESLERIAARLDRSELRELLTEAGRIVADPARLYSGPWVDQRPAPIVVARE
jgi:hypothetical protein